jgi:hypothetical protein
VINASLLEDHEHLFVGDASLAKDERALPLASATVVFAHAPFIEVGGALGPIEGAPGGIQDPRRRAGAARAARNGAFKEDCGAERSAPDRPYLPNRKGGDFVSRGEDDLFFLWPCRGSSVRSHARTLGADPPRYAGATATQGAR